MTLRRADDAGASPGTNRAIRRVAGRAVPNVSVMAVGPAFDDLAQGGPIPACVGVHAVINAEWTGVKWAPLTRARSLVDGSGHFRPTPHDHAQEGYDPDEVEAEVRAQVAKIRAAGLTPRYLDEHMGFAWLPGLRERLVRVAGDEGLVYAPDVQLVVFHPSEDDADSRSWSHPGLEPGQIARERQAELDALLAYSGELGPRYDELPPALCLVSP